LEVQPASYLETTALGVAYLAGLQAGIYNSLEEIVELRRPGTRFTPKMPIDQRHHLYKGWKVAVQEVLSLCV